MGGANELKLENCLNMLRWSVIFFPFCFTSEMAGLSPQCTTSPLAADIHEQNVTFVICALERMPSKLSILKELLIKTLFSLASKPTDCMFSVISCANQVTEKVKVLCSS